MPNYPQYTRIIAALGAISCLLAVLIGAFGAHALQAILSENGRTATYELASRYHFYHGLALLALAALDHTKLLEKHLLTAALLLFAGILVFSGSLYALAILNLPILGAVTPIGGLLLIAGWAVTLWSTFNK